MWTYLGLLLGYTILGGGIKYIDQAYDEHIFPKERAFLLAIFCGVLGGAMIISDAYTAVIFLSILLALLITGKIDNIAFQSATAIAIGICLWRIITSPIYLDIALWAIPTAILVTSAAVDEIGNDLADRYHFRGFWRYFFLYRFTMKIAMAFVAFFQFVPPFYLLAFLAFDTAYTIVEEWSWKIRGSRL